MNEMPRYRLAKTVYETVYAILTGTVDNANCQCEVCGLSILKDDKVAVYEEYETVKIVHLSHLETPTGPVIEMIKIEKEK